MPSIQSLIDEIGCSIGVTEKSAIHAVQPFDEADRTGFLGAAPRQGEARQPRQMPVFRSGYRLGAGLSKFSSQRRATALSLDRAASAGTIRPELIPAIGLTSAGHAG